MNEVEIIGRADAGGRGDGLSNQQLSVTALLLYVGGGLLAWAGIMLRTFGMPFDGACVMIIGLLLFLLGILAAEEILRRRRDDAEEPDGR